MPLWCRPGLSDAGLVAEFRREARVVRKGMDGDLIKVTACKLFYRWFEMSKMSKQMPWKAWAEGLVQCAYPEQAAGAQQQSDAAVR